MTSQEYFDLLGIEPTMDETIIKKAYRKKALKFHPDRNKTPQANEQFIKITEAYNYLQFAISQTVQEESQTTTEQSESSVFPQKDPYPFKSPEDMESRLKRAKQIYDFLKQKREQEVDDYFYKITSGKRWFIFRLIVGISCLLSFVFVLDVAVLPSKNEYGKIVKADPKIIYSGLTGKAITPIVLESGQKIWVDYFIFNSSIQEKVLIHKTPIFKEIKDIRLEKNGDWEIYPSEFSAIQIFPFFPILLLLPLFTYLFKARKTGFMIFYNISLYIIPIIIILLLILNNRFVNLLSFDYF